MLKNYFCKIFLLIIICIFVCSVCIATEVVSYHPRIWITPEYAKILQSRVKPATKQWDNFRGGYHGVEWLKNNFIQKNIMGNTETIIPLALAYQATRDIDYAKAGIAAMMNFLSKDRSPGSSFSKRSGLAEALISISIGYDWLHDALNKKEKAFITQETNKYISILLDDYISAPWHGHAIRNMLAIGLWGYASYGDNPRAGEFIRNARNARFEKLLGGMNELFGKGGALPAGTFYDFAAEILEYAEAVYTATGEDLFNSSSWFRDRMNFLLLSDYPGIFYDNNRSGYSSIKYNGTYGVPDKIPYMGYMIYEDGHRGRSTIADIVRTQKLILIHHYKDDPYSKTLQYSVTKKHLDRMCNPEASKAWEEFLWFDPAQEAKIPSNLSHYAKGRGVLLMRSDWSDDATWIFFKCGDMFSTSHQHWDQNSFSIFKKGDLAIKSGLYDGDGTAGHAVNYFSRTIGSNSILVYDANEQFISWRGVHYPNLLNDGGQKAYRDMNEFKDVAHWREYQDINDSGTITGYEDTSYYTYICGNATNAYNNSRNCTPKVIWKRIKGKNSPKITLFTRSLIFLRPDYVVIFDRVNATKASYRKKWLIHLLNKPLLGGYTSEEGGDPINGGMLYRNGKTITAEAGKGKLFVASLLPEKRTMRLVGGCGIEDYWVFGKNAAPGKNMSRWQNNYGEWRVEVEPIVPRIDDIFLNVIYPCDVEDNNFPQSFLVTSTDNNMTGSYIMGTGDLPNWLVLFSKNKDGNVAKVEYTIEGSFMIKQLLCNMKSNKTYEIIQNGQVIEAKHSSGNGLLYFESTLSGKNRFLIKEA